MFTNTSFHLAGVTPENCLAGISVTQSCTIQLAFTPATVGPQTGSLILDSNGVNDTTISLNGNALVESQLVLSPASGVYAASQSVMITDTNADAKIYYTTDGTLPTTSSIPYTGQIAVTSTERLTAVAFAGTSPTEATAAYTITSAPSSGALNFSDGFLQASQTVGVTGNAGFIDNRLRLTDGGLGERGSAFYSTPVNVQSFTTEFTFEALDPEADGLTFTIQNAGPAGIIGSGASGLGYTGILNSAAIKFDLYDNAGEGTNSTGLFVNGAEPTVPAVNLNGSGINLHSGDSILAQITYDGTSLVLTLTDTLTLATWSHSFAINIPATVGGNTAYVGFTGATGGKSAIQEVTSWTYVAGKPIAAPPPPPALTPPALPSFANGLNGTGLTLNGNAEHLGPFLELTDGGYYQASSAFYSIPVNIQKFTTDFSFQLLNPVADGFTFTIQNAGPSALGAYGSALGYSPIAQSVAIKFGLHSTPVDAIFYKNGATGIYLDGAMPTVPFTDLSTSNIDLHSGDVFNVKISYDATSMNLVLIITDTISGATFSNTFPVNIPQTVGGNTAYVGFTGGTGQETAIQQILSWTFTNP